MCLCKLVHLSADDAMVDVAADVGIIFGEHIADAVKVVAVGVVAAQCASKRLP